MLRCTYRSTQYQRNRHDPEQADHVPERCHGFRRAGVAAALPLCRGASQAMLASSSTAASTHEVGSLSAGSRRSRRCRYPGRSRRALPSPVFRGSEGQESDAEFAKRRAHSHKWRRGGRATVQRLVPAANAHQLPVAKVSVGGAEDADPARLILLAGPTAIAHPGANEKTMNIRPKVSISMPMISHIARSPARRCPGADAGPGGRCGWGGVCRSRRAWLRRPASGVQRALL